MTPTDCINGIAAAIEAITPDVVSNSEDVFRQVDTSEELRSRDRSFVIVPDTLPIRREDRIDCGERMWRLTVLLNYVATRNAIDRAAEDGELIAETLDRLHVTVTGITEVEVFEPLLSTEEGSIEALFSIVVTYSKDI